MYPCLLSHESALQVLMIILVLSSYSEGTSISLSPLGLVSVCPGEQVLLTCESVSAGSVSFLFWTVSVPRLAMTRDTVIADQGVISTTDLQFNGLRSSAFTVTRTSGNPLIIQMVIDVTTEMNGSTIYCSENAINGNANGTPMVTINVTNKDYFLNQLLNATIVNRYLRNSVTVTLQWPREAGAVYSVSVSPLIEMITNATSHNSFVINLTVSYNTQLNVSIASNLCDVTTTKVLKYVTCDLPTQLLHHPVVMINGSQETPYREGQFITYTCPPGRVLDGSNSSTCTENGEWEPDPGGLACIADCGVPLVDINVTLNYNSTLEDSKSILVLTCENDTSNNEQIVTVICDSNGNWIPDPTQFTCSSSTTVTVTGPPAAGTGREVILGSVLGVLIFTTIIITVASAILCLIKRGFLQPKRIVTKSDIQLENTYHQHAENSPGQPNYPVVQQDTLVYADIGPSSAKKRTKQFVSLKPDDMDDRVEYAALNHSIQKRVISTNQDSKADGSLNLDTLLIQVRGAVTPHWYQLGEALEVSKDVLDRCSNYPPEESIVEVLDQWLRNFPGRPTWRDVANALSGIGLQQLADDIEMVYETGKLPIAVDDNDDSQQVFTTTALELPHQEEERINYNHCQDESVPPLPPKPLAGSDVPKKKSAPPRPPKYVPK